MNKLPANTAVIRARELSRELVAVAERGDTLAALEIDAQRSVLLHGFLDRAHSLSESDRICLSEISKLNDSAMEQFERMRSATLGKLETVVRGQRAVKAYGSVQRRG